LSADLSYPRFSLSPHIHELMFGPVKNLLHLCRLLRAQVEPFSHRTQRPDQRTVASPRTRMIARIIQVYQQRARYKSEGEDTERGKSNLPAILSCRVHNRPAIRIVSSTPGYR